MKKSAETVETFLEPIKRYLESGEDGLGNGCVTFCVKEKHERLGRNPATGEDMMLEPRRVVTYRCLNNLESKLNGKSR